MTLAPHFDGATYLPFSDSIDARFERWLTDCPEVWPLFVRICREVKAAGYARYSADAVAHRIRWHFHVERRDGEFKLNDHFTSRLARRLMSEHPAEFRDFFETRRLHT